MASATSPLSRNPWNDPAGVNRVKSPESSKTAETAKRYLPPQTTTSHFTKPTKKPVAIPLPRSRQPSELVKFLKANHLPLPTKEEQQRPIDDATPRTPRNQIRMAPSEHTTPQSGRTSARTQASSEPPPPPQKILSRLEWERTHGKAHTPVRHALKRDESLWKGELPKHPGD